MNKVFLPFLAALYALFGGVEEKTGKHPKAAKQAKIQGRNKEAKIGEKRRSTDKQDKGVCR